MQIDTDPDFAPSAWLLPASARTYLPTVVRFLRLTYAVAESSALPPDARIACLRALADAVEGPADGLDAEAMAVMQDIRQMLAATSASPRHLQHLLQARQREAAGWRAEAWNDVLVHCQFAAAPIGRLVLDLCGEDAPRCGRGMDALATTLWVLLDLRDLRKFASGGETFSIPRQFFADAMISDLVSPAISARGQLRAVLDRVLDGVDRLLVDARLLPRRLAGPGMRWQAATLLCRAGKIARQLRSRDPLHVSVHLSSSQRWWCLLLGFLHRVSSRTT